MERKELMETLNKVSAIAVHDDREHDMAEPVLFYKRLQDGRWQETHSPRKVSAEEVVTEILQWAEEERLGLEYLYSEDCGIAHLLGVAD